MKDYYHYSSESKINSIVNSGMFADHPLYTTNQYYNSNEAGQSVGVMPHNIDCVLLFADDGLFRAYIEPIVPSTGRFSGGATQYSHPQRPKPIAKRRITERNWTRI